MTEDVYDKTLMIEKYKEVSATRRHYSALRFALLPFYFALQGAIAQNAFNKDSVDFPFFLTSVAGILTTYVFLTIEQRILEYYDHLERVGAKLETELNLGEKMFGKWPKTNYMSDTRRSIKLTYTVCLLFWIVYFLYRFIF